ncbi:MAG TPA: SDR family oxidoreductase [Streptosporangiales bacterium]
MAERTILLTGATDGLGRAVAERLAADGARVLAHGRDEERLRRTAEEIERATGSAVETVRADLASLDRVRALADEVRRRTDRLDVLVNNAGIGSGEPDGHDRRESADGHELRFAVNYLAGFLLTLELLPLLRRSAPARIVNVASLGQYPLDFDDLMLERGYDGVRAYGQSKLAQILFTMELAERLADDEVTVNALHPGTFMPTKMVLRERGSSVDTLETGVGSVVRLVSDPALDGVTGRFFDRTRESRVDDQAYDPDARRQLWARSLELTGAPDAR